MRDMLHVLICKEISELSALLKQNDISAYTNSVTAAGGSSAQIS
jgi:hypothetical protein